METVGKIGVLIENIYEAAQTYFGHSIVGLSCVSLDEVFKAVEKGAAQFGEGESGWHGGGTGRRSHGREMSLFRPWVPRRRRRPLVRGGSSGAWAWRGRRKP